ncbi:MAG: acyl-CoA dehydrogenase family protein [Dehalococcoidia bacterium]
MEFSFTQEEEQFRKDLQAFLEEQLPSDWLGEEPYDDSIWPFTLETRRKLGEKGWLAISWPKEYGGSGGTPGMAAVYSEEMAYYRAPGKDTQGVGFLGPCLMVHGTEEQRQTHLSPIAEGRVTWCQGFSEPESGSDLASLKTRAVEDGDDYLISGQKIWSSGAHQSDWCHLLARTDPDAPKHRGITYFLIDMKTPGVDVRRITDMSGHQRFNEIFLDNVRVPKTNVIGEVNQGWYAAMSTLDFERTAVEHSANARRVVKDLTEYARETSHNGASLLDDASVRATLAEMAVDAQIARLLSYRVLWLQNKGDIPNYEASMAKSFATEMVQRTADSAMRVLGLHGQLEEGTRWAPLKGYIERLYLNAVGNTIAGGTSEIQRNIIALRGLGLPRGA